MVSVLSDLGRNYFGKRKLLYVTDNEAFIPTAELERELNYYNLELTILPTDVDIKTIGKCIVVYDDERANGYPYSHYKAVFKKLGLTDNLFKKYVEFIGLSPVDKKDLINITIPNKDYSKLVPLDLLLFVLSNGKMNDLTNGLLLEKLLVSVGKIKKEQVEGFINTYRPMMKFICSRNEKLGEAVLPLYNKQIIAEDFDMFVDVIKKEYDNITKELNEIEVEDLQTSFVVKKLCDELLTNGEYLDTLKEILRDTDCFFFSKRNKRLNYVRI